MYLIISEEERKRAIQHIVENVPKKTLLQIREEISRDPDWLTAHHFGVGLEIRNLLRAGGFAWPDTTLDREWGPIMLEAAKSVRENSISLFRGLACIFEVDYPILHLIPTVRSHTCRCSALHRAWDGIRRLHFDKKFLVLTDDQVIWDYRVISPI